MATSTLGSGTLVLAGTTSGTTTVTATAVAGTTTLTLPAATDTLVGKATTDTLTNKTLTGAVMNGTLGATTPSTASVTTLTTSSTITHNGGTANGVAYLNGSKVLTTGGSLTWDGTNLTVNTGTVSATYGKLTVAGGISITPDSSSKFQIGRYSAGAPYSYIKMDSTSSGLKFTDPADSVDLMVLESSGNLLVGTTSTTGLASNAVIVAGGRFKTVSGSVSAATATATTLFTAPATLAAWLVTINVDADTTIYAATYVVNTQGGSSTVATQIFKGASVSISVSGYSVQATQNSGATATIQYSAVRIF